MNLKDNKDELDRLQDQLRGSHYVNLQVRRDGQDVYYEADWLKRLPEMITNLINEARKAGLSQGRVEGMRSAYGFLATHAQRRLAELESDHTGDAG